MDQGVAVRRFMGAWSGLAVVAVVGAGLVQALATPDHRSSLDLVVILASAALYLLAATVGTLSFERSGRRRDVALVFLGQMLFGGLTIAASRGGMAIVFLATASQAVLYLRARPAALVIVLTTGWSIAMAGWSLPVDGVVQGTVGLLAALAFVAAFSWIAVREHDARAQVQRLAEELAGANRRIEELATARERNRLARDVHDALGHTLTVVHVQLEAARSVLRSDPDRASELLAKARGLTQEGIAEVRRSVHVLRAGPEDPLDRALQKLVDQTREAGLTAELALHGAPRPLPDAVHNALYRAAQEALTNARRHAEASRVLIELGFRGDGRIDLRVEDDGRGAHEPTGGFGLVGLRERVAQVGGSVSIRTRPGRGFLLSVEVPG